MDLLFDSGVCLPFNKNNELNLSFYMSFNQGNEPNQYF